VAGAPGEAKTESELGVFEAGGAAVVSFGVAWDVFARLEREHQRTIQQSISTSLSITILPFGITGVGGTVYRNDCVSIKRAELGQGIISKRNGGFTLRKHILKSTSYLLPLASKTSFTEY
jgi:hypothetical protein